VSNSDVVREAAMLLSKAQSGEIQAITYFYTNDKSTVFTGGAGRWSRERALFAFVTWLSRFILTPPEDG